MHETSVTHECYMNVMDFGSTLVAVLLINRPIIEQSDRCMYRVILVFKRKLLIKAIYIYANNSN